MDKTCLDALVVNGPVDLTNSTINVSGGQEYEYDAGQGARIKANSKNVSFAKSNGVGTFIGCSGSFKFRIHGQTSDLAPDNSFTVVFEGISSDKHDDVFPPSVLKYNRNNGSSPVSNPWNYDIDNTPLAQIINFNPLTIRFINMNAFSHWGLLGTL
jgi:hypothetical protein